MQPNVNEENEIVYNHNLSGMAPANFTDVEDEELRRHNRGAVLANIFERYVDPIKGSLKPKDLMMCIREIQQYLLEIPEHERDAANASMHEHLTARGYREAIVS